MQELSLSILDIVQNSISAKATQINISLILNSTFNKLKVFIADNGQGIPFSNKQKIYSPFFTTRQTRRIGLGLSMLKMNSELSNGYTKVVSVPLQGTSVSAEFQLNHVNRPPLGNLVSTVCFLIQGNPTIHFCFEFKQDNQFFCLDTTKLEDELQGISLENPMIIHTLYPFVAEKLYFLQDMGFYLCSD